MHFWGAALLLFALVLFLESEMRAKGNSELEGCGSAAPSGLCPPAFCAEGRWQCLCAPVFPAETCDGVSFDLS